MKRHVRPGLTLRKIGAAEDGALRAQQVERRGVTLENFLMEKEL